MPAQSSSRASRAFVTPAVVLATLFALGTFAACSATSTISGIPDGGDPDTGVDPATGDSGKKDDAAKDSGKDSSKPGTGEPTEADCVKEPTAEACGTCCAGFHVSGYKIFEGALRTCACAAGGPCVTECAASSCNAAVPKPDATCRTCLEGAMNLGGGPCLAPVSTACQADADCVANYLCFSKCPTD